MSREGNQSRRATCSGEDTRDERVLNVVVLAPALMLSDSW